MPLINAETETGRELIEDMPIAPAPRPTGTATRQWVREALSRSFATPDASESSVGKPKPQSNWVDQWFKKRLGIK